MDTRDTTGAVLVKENIDNCCLYFPAEVGLKTGSLYRTIEAKVHDGDLRGAVRLLFSDSTLAPANGDTLEALVGKHPSPSRQLNFPPEPDLASPFLTVTQEEVVGALGSFYNGSASGLDGLRPQHLKELTSVSAGDNGGKLLESLTRLCNFLLRGMVNPQACPYLYGASLCALAKRDGGVRPIAVGNTLRRLVSKLACRAVKEEMAEFLQPCQVGFGTPLGCEGAIHAVRSYAMAPENDSGVVLKVDIKNAFNTVERDVILREVRDRVPSLYPYLHQCYFSPTNLFYGTNLIASRVGAQQGDPLGPLLFCLAVQSIVKSLSSPLNVWYLDDGTLGGAPDVVLGDVRQLVQALSAIGLQINAEKCELFLCSPDAMHSIADFEAILPGVKVVERSSLSLLGAPIFPEGVGQVVQEKTVALSESMKHLQHLSAHVSLVLLRNCLSIPRVTYTLRTAPTWMHGQAVLRFDQILQNGLESILNVRFEESQWCQATLPIRHGGLGVRRMHDVGLVAFLASSHASRGLVARILSLNEVDVHMPFLGAALDEWTVRCSGGTRPDDLGAQRSWDDVLCRQTYEQLLEGASGVEQARLKAVAAPESGAWLHALPSSHLGTLLDNDSLRIGAALRLGCNVCEPHLCVCGVMVEANGHHGLSCVRCAGRFPRHHAINDIVRRAMVSANLPCVLEPQGLSRTDGKRPDGLTLVPWAKGRSLLWDATCITYV
ncbi:uncharacterized protein LOC134747408 [Cydia strobilella]|uniref:uncharacterized protein LOC134747408 n=1 Tax=Cydia strobilella TaxID=1100964 RepID=UPI0030059EFC